eukprot:9336884-Alexandrium_andersonii.AAC.1
MCIRDSGSLRQRFRNLRAKWRGTHPSGAPGTKFEAGPGPAQFKLGALEATLHVPNGGLRIGACWGH